MSTETESPMKKRKRASKGHELHTPSRKRSKQDLTTEQTDSPVTNGDRSQDLQDNTVAVLGDDSLETLQAPKEEWNVSAPVGGRFLNAPPIFSHDEKFLLLAVPRAIHVYDCATSLLSRKLSLPETESSTISAYAVSSASASRIYAATKSGTVFSWDWKTGQLVGEWKVGDSISNIVIDTIGPNAQTVIYTQEFNLETGNAVIKAHEINEPREDGVISDVAPATILSHRGKIGSFQVHLDGRVIVVALQNGILVGERHIMESWALGSLNYTWRELTVTDAVTSFDVRIRILSESWKQDFSHRQAPKVDVAIGRKGGEVTVYEDILTKLIRFEHHLAPPEDRLPHQFHWHRRPVGSVRWSLDGNYLISGGQEMALVMWQLATGKKNVLPYLVSAISQVVVSPSGAAYAILLEDNSIIVLSTTELEAKTSITGVQSNFLDSESFARKASFADVEGWQTFHRYLTTPATIDPLRPSHILAAVPSSIVQNVAQPSTPYLQRFDISTSRHIYRQALTRNNATHVNESPDGVLLSEPNVTHLQVSHDGKWMATVEEWTPPPSDLDHVGFGWDYGRVEQEARREVYLKFWRRNMDNHTWALDTRIDMPHVRADGMPSSIFALVAEPNHTGFSTVGDDGFVRVWKPKTRLEDGRFVRGARGKRQGIVIWSARHAIYLGRAAEGMETDSESSSSSQKASVYGCMAYSTDGSVLAVSQVLPDEQSQGVVHLIDATSGEVQHSIAGFWSSGLAGMGLLDQYLIVVSDDLHVWDLVHDRLVYSLSLEEENHDRWPRIAVNPIDRTFALTVPPRPDSTSVLGSTVLVLKPTSATPVHSLSIPSLAIALMPAHGLPGYIVLDAAAEIRTITPKSTAGIPLISELAANGNVDGQDETALEEDDDDDNEMEVDEDVEMDGVVDGDDEEDGIVDDAENDRPVVRTEQLAQIFDVGPSFALPPVQDLFNSVVGLYARKTRA